MIKLRHFTVVLLIVSGILHVNAQNKADSLLDAYFSVAGIDRIKAMYLALEALKAARTANDRHNEAVALECIGVQHYYRGNYREATKYLSEAENIYRNEKSYRGLASVYNNLGLVEQDLGNYPRAIACFSYALINDDVSGDSTGRALTLSNLGTVYLYKGQYSRAKQYFEHALRIGQQTGNAEVKGNALNNLGLVYLDALRFDSALMLFRQARLLADAENDLYGLTIARINEAMALAGLNLTDSAARCFDEIFPAIEALNDPDLEMEYLIHLSELALQLKEYNLALQKLLFAQKINNRLEQKKKSAEIFRRMGSALARLQNVESALAYLHLSRNIAFDCGIMPELAATYGELSLAHGVNKEYDSAKYYMEKFAKLRSQILFAEPDSTLSAGLNPLVKTERPGNLKMFLRIGISLALFWLLLLFFMRLARKKRKAENKVT